MSVAVLAHNEDRHIAACLASLPLAGRADRIRVHVVVNGSSDRTAEIVRKFAGRYPNVHLHVLALGDKCNAWNFYVHDIRDQADVYFFIDGDARVEAGSLSAMAGCFDDSGTINAVSALPLNGREMKGAQDEMRRTHGLYGDLYALAGQFVDRLRARNIRLPVGKVGDDALVCALAKTDLGLLAQWRNERVAVCERAGFYCEPVAVTNPAHLRMQYKRLIRYSVRHYEIKMMQQILRSEGPGGLPRDIAALHCRYIDLCKLRWRGMATYFDWLALRRIRANVRLHRPDASRPGDATP